MDKLKMQTNNIAEGNFKKLSEMFPNAVTETIDADGKVVRAIDKDVLMQEISCEVVEGREERYQFTWPDKKKAILLANSPINSALRPCKEESVDFDNTQNLYIEGDNLDVLKLLRETYLGKVKMIYIDPPYNTGKDFVYEDNFIENADEYIINSGQMDEDGNKLFQNTESNGRFHTDWLNMVYPRLKVAKDLLTEDGAVFVSVDDNEQENLKKICDEIFGVENNVVTLKMLMRHPDRQLNSKAVFQKTVEYCYVYCKNKSEINITKRKKEYTFDDYNKRIITKCDGVKRVIGNKEVYVFKPNEYEIIKCNDINTLDIVKDISIRGTIKTAQNTGKYYESYLRDLLESDGNDCLYKVMNMGEDGIGYRFIKQPSDTTINGIYYQGIPEEIRANNFNAEKELAWSDVCDYIETNNTAGKEISNLFDKKVFDTPKPILLIKDLLNYMNDKNMIVLDFFSGSATTAHAVMELNAEDGGNRKFIMVQLPEKCYEKSEAYKAGYGNICEIGKERIRRAGSKIIAKMLEDNEHEEKINAMDTGFRVLKLDSSNMKDVYYTPDEYNRTLFDDLEDNIKEDRTPEDLLFQVMLELGIPLSSKIDEQTIDGKKVFNVADNHMLACFDTGLTDEVITTIAKQKPLYFVMRDSSLDSDSVAINFDQIFETYSKDTVRRVL